MSYKFNEGTTTTIDRPTAKTDVADLVDKRVEQNTAVAQNIADEVKREMGRFDTSHRAEKLNQVYDEIDRQAVAKEAKTPEIANPFMGDNDSLERLHKNSFKDVIDTPNSPTLEIKAYKDKKETKSKKLSSRMKLWITTGACCAVLLFGLVICNALSIGAIERDISSYENALARQEQELSSLEGSISSESSTIPDGMTAIGEGRVIDISATTNTEIVTSDNFFNRLSRFIAYLFGR